MSQSAQPRSKQRGRVDRELLLAEDIKANPQRQSVSNGA
jgi:hypothetical protein